MAGEHRQEHHIDITVQSCLRAAKIGHQNGCDQAWKLLGACQDFSRIDQLNQQPRRDERADPDFAQPCGVCAVQPLDLGVCRNDPGNALQAVAQADFANDDRF